MTDHDRIVAALTEYDRRQERKPGHNRYALPQYFGALTDAEKAMTRGVPTRSALVHAFGDRVLAVCFKAIGEDPPTDAELRC